jgi:hypothetical protein
MLQNRVRSPTIVPVSTLSTLTFSTNAGKFKTFVNRIDVINLINRNSAQQPLEIF